MEHWNIQKCRDFGDIVFNLVDFGILGRTENDSLEDFEGGYSFEEAFELPSSLRIWKKTSYSFLGNNLVN